MADTLNFEPTERISWRQDMTVSEMLDCITKFQEKYKTARIHEDEERQKEIRKKLLLGYFMGIMEGENIGVQSEGETRQIMDQVDAEDDDQSQSTSPEINVNAADTATMPAELAAGTSSLPPSLEEDSFMEDNGDRPISRKKQETINLYKAYKHIKGIVKEEQGTRQNNPKLINIGFLDVETCILKTHEILLSDLNDEKHGSRPGKFSTNKRKSGDGFEYPHFLSEGLAEAAIQQLVDRHNDNLNKMERIEDNKERVKYLFKCTSLFLSAFLWLHPFGDGNGRLARLLCGYMLLRSVFPFTLPIYNVYSVSSREHYLQALKEAQSADRLQKTLRDENEARRAANIALEQEPKLLCSLLIESNLCVWNEYEKRLAAESQGKTKEVGKCSSGNDQI